MNILYLGDHVSSSTSFHRASSLIRLGHEVYIHNPNQSAKSQLENPFLNKLHYFTGYQLLQLQVRRWLKGILTSHQHLDLIWVNSGELTGMLCLKYLKSRGFKVVLYNNDDPTGGRDGNRFISLIKAIPFYDLCVVMREVNIDEYMSLGAKNVLRVTMSYDEVWHKPLKINNPLLVSLKSDICFIGTWMLNEGRDEFLLYLINKGLPVSIWGDRWENSPFWGQLLPHFRGNALTGEAYVAAIQSSKICLGMLSKGNRDYHTTRSMEIPFIGGMLCAERTSEHLRMYNEGSEAMFWSDPDECVNICWDLLNNEHKRREIQLAGMKRVRENGSGNENICLTILNELALNA